MATVTTKLQCSKCSTGVVKLVVKSTKRGDISAETKCCDNKQCKAFFGLKSVRDLKQID